MSGNESLRVVDTFFWAFLIGGKINESFVLENALNLTQDFEYDNFNEKICVVLLLNLS